MYRDIYLDLYEMRCYVAVHRYNLAINLESELCDSRILQPGIRLNGPLYCMPNAKPGVHRSF